MAITTSTFAPRKHSHDDDVFFSASQLQYLEHMFPHVVLGPTSTEEAMRHYFGQQAVLEAVRRKTRGLNANTTNNRTGDIPSPSR
jgi:hypothetical protein